MTNGHYDVIIVGTGAGGGTLAWKLAPTDGRPYPADAKPSDLFHWQTKLLAANADDLAASLRTIRTTFVTSAVVDPPETGAGYRKTLTVRDPEGHAVQIVEK